jgi:hypothetical protein
LVGYLYGFKTCAGFGTPQLGQVLASVETALPHSLQLDIAISLPYQTLNQMYRYWNPNVI